MRSKPAEPLLDNMVNNWGTGLVEENPKSYSKPCTELGSEIRKAVPGFKLFAMLESEQVQMTGQFPLHLVPIMSCACSAWDRTVGERASYKRCRQQRTRQTGNFR